jgi:hypothetical protein
MDLLFFKLKIIQKYNYLIKLIIINYFMVEEEKVNLVILVKNFKIF